MNGEEIFDREIGPLLLQAATIAKANAISLVAVCQFESDKFSTTRTVADGAAGYVRLVDAAVQSGGNIDKMIFRLMDESHTSLCLVALERAMDMARAAK